MSSSVDQVAEFVFAKAQAQRSATLVQVAALAGAVACVALAALLQEPINSQRKDLQLVLHSDLYKELPPKYAWVSAAGGTFRGVAADLLWMRAEGLKEQGKYYELHQLAKWICTLQPRFAGVWAFQAWNMSYNISVSTHTARERWQWVYNGVRLLRDEGIPNNERAVTLYHELARIFWHKMGDRLDDFHLSYKRVWATTMEVLLGSPPGGASDEEQANYLKPVADAPLTLEALLAKRPGIGKLVEQLKAVGIDVDADTNASNMFHPLEENFFKPYTMWLADRKFSPYLKKHAQPSEQTGKLWAILNAAPDDDIQALIAYMRAEVLREQYKMDPRYMLEITRNLGTEKPIPIDWRTPWAHAIYWGMYGLEKGHQVKNVEEFELLSADRIVIYSIGSLARQGHYIFRPNLESPENSFLDMSPDWRYIEAIHKTCLMLGQRYREKNEQVFNTAGATFKDYHVNTLQVSVLNLYLAGKEKEAQYYYDYLVKYYPDPDTGETREPYKKTFQDFMQAEIKDLVQSQHETMWLLHSLLRSIYLSLGNGQMSDYSSRMSMAVQLYKGYAKDTDDDRQGRRTLPPWEQIQAVALRAFVSDGELPLALRFAVWNRIDSTGANITEVKQRCYDDVRRILDEWYGKGSLDIDKAFPAPPGMAQWRQSHAIVSPEQVAAEAQKKKKEEENKQQGK